MNDPARATQSHFIDEPPETTRSHAFIQWKGTDLCMDFYCECGSQLHFDGDFAYVVQCPKCSTNWEMPAHVYPRKWAGDEHHTPKVMDMDEEDEAEGFDWREQVAASQTPEPLDMAPTAAAPPSWSRPGFSSPRPES